MGKRKIHIHTNNKLRNRTRPATWKRILRAITPRRSVFKKSYVQLRRQRKRLANVGTAALILTSTILPLVDFGSAQAANAELSLESDVTTGWIPSTGTTHYTLLDEPSTAPVTTDYISTGTAGSGGEIAEFGLESTVNVATVTNVKVYIYAYSATNANGGTLDTVSINLRIGGSLQTAATVTPAYSAGGTHVWYNGSFDGSWTQAQLDAAQAYLVHNVLGGNPAKNADDDVRVAAVYADITYTQSTTFDQSSYRWFGNEDSTGGITFAKSWGGTGSDEAHALALDASGNIYVAGYTASTGLSAGSRDQTLVKYDSSGVEQWSKTWEDTLLDEAKAIALDATGNIYVVGNTQATIYPDQTLVKYDSSGVEQWSKTWGGTGSDYANALALDASGNIYVAGYTNSTGLSSETTYRDQTLVKYNSSGVEQWSKTWGGDNSDGAQALALDASGNIYVAGYTASTGLSAGSSDQTLVKYNSSGIEQWSKTWGGTGYDHANALALDSTGNIYVAGDTNSTGLSSETTYSDQTLVKYNSSGVEQWSKTWGGDNYDQANALALDTSGNIYAAGYTASTGLTAGGYDQTLLKFDNTGNIYGCIACVDRTTSETDRTVTEVDRTTSETDRTTSETDRTVTEVDRTGDATITIVCDVPTIDVADPLAVLNTAANAPSEGTPFRLRMNLHVNTAQAEPGLANFKLQYAARGADNVCDTSFTNETYADLSPNTGPIRFYNNTNAVDGQPLTTNTDDPTHSTDDLVRQSYEESNNFTVANAIPAGDDGMWDFALVDAMAPASTTYCFRAVTDTGTVLNSYAVVPQITTASSTLSQASFRAYEDRGVDVPGFIKGWGGTGNDYAYALALDASGNIYVAGNTISAGLTAGDYDQTLVKYNSAGVEQWSKTWGGAGSDTARALALDASGNIYVAGDTASAGLTAGSYDQTLVKYNSAGVEQWSKTWGGDSVDYAYALALDSTGNIYVAGYTMSTGLTAGSYDQTLVKYDSSGVEQWSKTWGGTGTDIAYALALDSAGNIYVAGETNSTGLTVGLYDQTLVKYNSAGVEQWSKTWGGDSVDYAYALALDSTGNIYVAGYTMSTGLTAGSYDQTLWRTTTEANDCSGICILRTDVTVIEDRTGVATMEFRTVTEVDRTDVTTIVDRTAVTTIVDRTGVATITEIYVPKTFAKAWGGTGADYGYSLVQTSDGGYAVTGYTISYGSDDMFLAKYDSSGTLSWSKTWGGTSIDYGYSLVQTSDGGYAVTGTTSSYGAGFNDMFLAKYDSSGTLSWSRTWGGTGTDQGYSLVQTSDGGYAVIGTTNSYGAGSNDMFLAKYDSSGTLSWSRTWGGTSTDQGQSLVQTSDGGYAVIGTTSYGVGGTDMFLAKYDSSGTLSWSRTWGGTGTDQGYSLVQTSDGGYAVTGTTNSYGAGFNDMFLAKYDSSGTLSWSRTWGGTGAEYGQSLIQTSDGGYAVTGYTTSYGAGSNDMFLAKYDSYGDIRGCTSTNCTSPAAYTSSPTPTTSSPTPTTSSPTPTTSSPTPTTSSPTATTTNIFTATPISYLQNGTALAAMDTRAELLETDMDFRLRIGLLASGKKYTGTGTFKIQSGVFTGTCDPSTTSYTDVSSATSPIAFYDNSFATTGDKVHPDTTNPVVTSTRETMQTYIEANTFNNPRQMDINDTGIWDFALKADGAKIGRTYCFRIVESGASLNGGYSQYAEVYIPPTMGNVMRHGKFFNTQGTQQPFAWGRE